ncbi:hypothetical protein SAMN04488700_0817 [Carnobacterium iners]|uniref:Uncharacterized protein n=1 Tax=Carnobacterium iners TaxID=1073423 RepID=A0A1X7MV72_9LACT|nr:hypothetical protein [Carnobacterium iners]SEL05993.1 hypothetical protein SAMN04488114_1232 [Carnobacterium iners]SMH28007.1 hypothetical protein SAMN04488700_0817 [Carnobacterium iners]
MVASDSHFITSSILEIGGKDKSAVNKLLQARDYMRKKRIKVIQNTILLNVIQMEIEQMQLFQLNMVI